MNTKAKREKLTLETSVMEALITMSEGNPGAASVLAKLMQKYNEMGFMAALHLDDMNMRGSQIWVGYKDYCGQDLEKFFAALTSRDPAMVAKVNEKCGYTGELAVTHGSSCK